MNFNILTSSLAALALSAGLAQAATIDLTTWSAEGAGSWAVQTGDDSVIQGTNGNPTVFHNNTASSQGNDLRGEITVNTTSDDDFIGFVLGYNSGDLANAAASYLLIDWKQRDQSAFGATGLAGLAISQVSGVLGNNSGAWSHDPTNNVTELARATTLGSTGWVDNTTYDFRIDFTATNVRVFVNDVLEIDVNGVFADGGFGFYNYSQASVEYAGITSDALPPVPLPAAGWMLLAGLGGLAAAKRRKQA